MLLWMAIWFIGVVPSSNVSMVPSRSPEMGYVYVQPADTTVSFGECPSGVRLSVMVDSNVAALHSFSLSITFDSSVIESNWDSILPGSIFPDTLFPYLLGDIYNGDSIHVDLAIMGQGMHVNGPGEILSLWFKPKIGETDIDIIDAVSVLRDTVMPMGNHIPHYCIDGHITALPSYVYVQPADTTVSFGECPSGVRLSVMVDSNVAALHSFSLSITFDSSVIESNWDSILPGSIFPDTLFPYLLGDIYNGDSIHVDLAIMGQGMHVNGPGEILSLWFKPKIGETDIDIIDAVSVLRDTVMPMGNPIPHYCIDGHITALPSYVYVQPADTTVYLLESPSGVRLSVMVDSNVAALHSFSLSITFDSSVIESNWDSILPGSIFPDTLFPYLLGDIYNGDSIHVDLAIMGQGMHVNGPGEILSLWFKPKIGETDIDIIDAVSVLRDTVMPMGNSIPHYCIDGHITVLRSPYDYDVAIEGIPNEGDPAFVGDTLVALILDPYVTVCNRTVPGGPILSFRVWCKIINNEMGYIIYSRHVNVWNLAPQECRTIYFPSGAFFMYPGIYVMVTTIQVSFDDPDLSNNVSLRAFYVPPYRAGSEEETAPPAVFALEQNHPNPVRGKATIRYQIPERRTVSISVYDISGREVKTLVIGPKEPGYYSVSLDTKELPQGIYLVKMKAGSFKGVQRMVILK